jgi:hypothetical protein
MFLLFFSLSAFEDLLNLLGPKSYQINASRPVETHLVFHVSQKKHLAFHVARSGISVPKSYVHPCQNKAIDLNSASLLNYWLAIHPCLQLSFALCCALGNILIGDLRKNIERQLEEKS